MDSDFRAWEGFRVKSMIRMDLFVEVLPASVAESESESSDFLNESSRYWKLDDCSAFECTQSKYVGTYLYIYIYIYI